MPTKRLFTGTNIAASGQSGSTDTHMPVNQNMIVFLDVTAVSASDTLDVKLQESVDDSTWKDVTSGAFTQATGATSEIIKVTNVAQYVRVDYTVGGAAIDISFTVDASWSDPTTDGIQ